MREDCNRQILVPLGSFLVCIVYTMKAPLPKGSQSFVITFMRTPGTSQPVIKLGLYDSKIIKESSNHEANRVKTCLVSFYYGLGIL